MWCVIFDYLINVLLYDIGKLIIYLIK